jgi:hypothetical protein
VEESSHSKNVVLRLFQIIAAGELLLLQEAYFMGRCYCGARSNLGLKIGPVLKVVAVDDFRFKNLLC